MSEVRVFYTPLVAPLTAKAVRDALGALPAGRRAALARYRDRRARDRSLIGERLLVATMHACGYGNFTSSAVVRPRGGKPDWPAGPDFSIAHADDLVAVAVSRAGSVGLDVEGERPLDRRSLRLVLTPEECERAAGDPHELLGLWTRREAVVKATGQSLTWVGDVVLDGDRATLDGIVLWLARVDLDPHHVAHVAVTQPMSAVVVTKLDVV